MKKNVKYIILYIIIVIICFSEIIPFLNGVISYIIFSLSTLIISYYVAKNNIIFFSLSKFLLIFSFLFIIIIPLIGDKETESLEKRPLAEFPTWRWRNVWKFFFEYQAYFEDRFAFRNEILDAHGTLKYDVFGFSALTNKVKEGKDEWLFYADMPLMTPVSKPFTKKELQQFHYNLEIITKWLNQHGVKYYLTIPPITHTIYPEKLPDYLKIVLNFSRMDQLNSYLKKHSSVNFIGYKSELTVAKKYRQLYYDNDTHWNPYGAFIGYTKIINTLSKDFNQIVPNELEDYEERWVNNHNPGDLLMLLGKKPLIGSVLLFRKDSVEAVFQKKTGNIEEWKMPIPVNDLKLFVIRDSYSEQLKRFLSTNFKQSFYFWQEEIPIEKIRKEKPDLVLHEMSERLIAHYLKLPPEIEKDTAFTNQFNISDF